jgi:hypothetical protein
MVDGGTSGEVEPMPDVPSIKGGVFSLAIEDLSKLVADETISRDEVARRLEPGDLEYLDEEIRLTGWYDIRAYARIVELLKELEGGGSNEYLRMRGARSAEHLLQAGLYQQLEYLKRTQLEQENDPRARFLAFGRDLRLLATMSGTVLSFTSWKSKPDPAYDDRYVIEVSDANDFPETLCWTSDGFINQMATRHGEPALWGWDRPRRDFVIYRMLRPV